jgi:ribosomal protein L22
MSSEEEQEALEASEVTSTSEGKASKPPDADVTPEPDTPDASAESVKESDGEAAESEAAVEEEPQSEAVAEEAPKRRRRSAAAEAKDAEAPAEPKPRARRGATKAKPQEPKPKRAVARPRRGRARRTPGEALPVVRAQAKYVRSSARKARLVCDHIRGKSVEDARAILANTQRAVARDWSKLLESAVANAEHNHELVGEDLYVKAVRADEGPTIKRFRPRAQGRATRIRKRTSHLTILLTPRD